MKIESYRREKVDLFEESFVIEQSFQWDYISLSIVERVLHIMPFGPINHCTFL